MRLGRPSCTICITGRSLSSSSAHSFTALLVFSLLGGLSCLSNAAKDVKLRFAKERWCNPSLVKYGGKAFSAAKRTELKRSSGKTWWINSLYMCDGDEEDLHALKCKNYNPWKSRFSECAFDSRVRKGKLDVTGLGDVKVWVWPGKGVYTIFGRKPLRKAGSTRCNDLIVYHQWLSQVHADPALDPTDPWQLLDRDPLPLLPSEGHHDYPEGTSFVMEKNWMPFVYKDPETKKEQLFVTYMVAPHIIFEVFPNGTSIHRWTTRDDELLKSFRGYDVHGGPPVVYVPPQQSGDGQAYYMGIMHHIERYDNGRVRHYRHFAYKARAQPPFPLYAISDELPLIFNQTHKERTFYVAFVSGLFLSETGNFVITYGSADIESRALTMTVYELEALFTGRIKFRDIVVPYEEMPTNVSSSSATLQADDTSAHRKSLIDLEGVEEEEDADYRTGTNGISHVEITGNDSESGNVLGLSALIGTLETLSSKVQSVVDKLSTPFSTEGTEAEQKSVQGRDKEKHRAEKKTR